MYYKPEILSVDYTVYYCKLRLLSGFSKQTKSNCYAAKKKKHFLKMVYLEKNTTRSCLLRQRAVCVTVNHAIINPGALLFFCFQGLSGLNSMAAPSLYPP
jgi:hypothetical protein